MLGHTVVLWSGGADDRVRSYVEEAVTEELVAAGIAVRVLQRPVKRADASVSPLVAAAIDESTRLAFRLILQSGNDEMVLEVVVATGNGWSVHHLALPLGERSDDLQTSVLRIVETVRALLIRGSAGGRVAVPPGNGAKKAYSPPWRFGLGMGAVVIGGPGGVDPAAGIEAQLHLNLHPTLFAIVDFSWGFYNRDIRAHGERATFDTTLISGGLYWNLVSRGRVHPALGVLGGTLVVSSAGQSDTASEGVANYQEVQQVGYAGGAVRLGISMGAHAGLVLEGRVGALLPEVKLYFKDRLAARFGRPMVNGLLGFEVGFR